MAKLVRAVQLGFYALACIGIAAGLLLLFAPKAQQPLPKTYANMTLAEARVFDRACKDCHSNDTEWPWYSKIPPVSLGVVADVRRGRTMWNISQWSTYSRGKKLGFLTAIATDAATGNMPPRAYRLLHPSSTLNESDKMLLTEWANAERMLLRRAIPSAPGVNQPTPNARIAGI